MSRGLDLDSFTFDGIKRKTMKTIGNITIISLILVLFSSSCTVEKRVHLKGYHIEWKGKNKPTKPKLVKKEKVRHQQEVVEISDSVGTLIKDVVAEQNSNNQDSILKVVAVLMSHKTKENTLVASIHKTTSKRIATSVSMSKSPVYPTSEKKKKTGRTVLWIIVGVILTVGLYLLIVAALAALLTMLLSAMFTGGLGG